MTLRQLEIFHAVTLQRTLSGAARDLGLTQPAVSLQMKRLQAELGTALLRSRGQRLEPTQAGETLRGYAERILRLTGEARAAVVLRGRQLELVRVAASSTPGPGLLPRLIGRFRRRAPGAVVQLEVLNTRQVEERVASGEADIGVVGGRLSEARLLVEPWQQDELVLIVSPSHALARKRVVSAHDLAAETLLTRERGSATRATYEAALREAGLPVPSGASLGSTEAIKRAVEAGMGVGIVSRFSVTAELRSGSLRARRIRGISLIRPFFILLSPGTELSPSAAQFLKFLRSQSKGG